MVCDHHDLVPPRLKQFRYPLPDHVQLFIDAPDEFGTLSMAARIEIGCFGPSPNRRIARLSARKPHQTKLRDPGAKRIRRERLAAFGQLRLEVVAQQFAA